MYLGVDVVLSMDIVMDNAMDMVYSIVLSMDRDMDDISSTAIILMTFMTANYAFLFLSRGNILIMFCMKTIIMVRYAFHYGFYSLHHKDLRRYGPLW
jgi:hypothetical protein